MVNKLTSITLSSHKKMNGNVCSPVDLYVYNDSAVSRGDFTWTPNTSINYTAMWESVYVFKSLNSNKLSSLLYNQSQELAKKYLLENLIFAVAPYAGTTNNNRYHTITPSKDSELSILDAGSNRATFEISNCNVWKYSNDATGVMTKVGSKVRLRMQLNGASVGTGAVVTLTNESTSNITIKEGTDPNTSNFVSYIRLNIVTRSVIREDSSSDAEVFLGGLDNRLNGVLVNQNAFIKVSEIDNTENMVMNGVVEGLLVADSPAYFNLEPGAMYYLMTNSHLKHTGAYRGSHSYVIAAHGKQGATTTAQAVGHSVQVGAMGTTGLTLQHTTYVISEGSGTTYYGSRIGIGSCTTQCRVKYALFKIMGSDDDFEGIIPTT